MEIPAGVYRRGVYHAVSSYQSHVSPDVFYVAALESGPIVPCVYVVPHFRRRPLYPSRASRAEGERQQIGQIIAGLQRGRQTKHTTSTSWAGQETYKRVSRA